MERLTLNEAIKHAKEVADMNYNDAEKFDSNDSVENYMKANCMKCAEEHEQLVEWLEELKFYKEAEEQGLLVRLPVPLGSKVYWISTRDKQNPIIFEKIFVLGMLYFWDSTVFATREEAEKKLEEMKNDKT